MIKQLIKIANKLDKRGLAKEADLLDKIILKLAGSGEFYEDWDLNKEEEIIQEDQKVFEAGRDKIKSWFESAKNIKIMEEHYPGFIDAFIDVNFKEFLKLDALGPKYIDSGASGDAFLLEDGDILKIYSDRQWSTGELNREQMHRDRHQYVYNKDSLYEAIPGSREFPVVYAEGILEIPRSYKGAKLNFSWSTSPQSYNPYWVIIERFDTLSERSKRYFKNKKPYTEKDAVSGATTWEESKTSNSAKKVIEKIADLVKRNWKNIEKKYDLELPFLCDHSPEGYSCRKEYPDQDSMQAVLRASVDLADTARREVSEDDIKLVSTIFDMPIDWMEKFIKHLVYLRLTGKGDFNLVNLGIRPQTEEFIYFDA